MKLSELMQGKTPRNAYKGFATNDDFVLAIDTGDGETQTPESDFAVVEAGITKNEASANTETKKSQYIRTGKMTTKTGAQRQFTIEGDRYLGDDFQDFCTSLDIVFGVGAEVVRPYLYFNLLTGEGEQGTVTIIMSDTQAGDAGENASFKAELTSTQTPQKYVYSPISGS